MAIKKINVNGVDHAIDYNALENKPNAVTYESLEQALDETNSRKYATKDEVPPKTDDGYTWELDQANIRRLELVDGGKIFYNYDNDENDGTVIKYNNAAYGFTQDGKPLITNGSAEGGLEFVFKETGDTTEHAYCLPATTNGEGLELASTKYVDQAVANAGGGASGKTYYQVPDNTLTSETNQGHTFCQANLGGDLSNKIINWDWTREQIITDPTINNINNISIDLNGVNFDELVNKNFDLIIKIPIIQDYEGGSGLNGDTAFVFTMPYLWDYIPHYSWSKQGGDLYDLPFEGGIHEQYGNSYIYFSIPNIRSYAISILYFHFKVDDSGYCVFSIIPDYEF